MKAIRLLAAALFVLASIGLTACGGGDKKKDAKPAAAAPAPATAAPVYPACANDSHCAAKGQVCVSGTCKQCRDHGQCSALGPCGRCQANSCVKAPGCCATDADCNGGRCRGGQCR